MKKRILNHKRFFLILVAIGLSSGMLSISYAQVCSVGDRISPGESCTYPGTNIEFSVRANGSGNFLFFTAGGGINARNVTVNGVRYNFAASKQADGTWLIEAAGDGSTPQPVSKPDLVVQQPTVSNSTLAPGASFTLSATVENNGAGRAAATTLRYYRSTNTTISSSDTEVGTDSVSALGSNQSSAESISLTAPSSPGTYYYGACVEAVTGESSSNNNCSAAVSITVQQVTDPTPPTGGTTYSVGADIPTLPTGFWNPDFLSGASFAFSGGKVTLTFSSGGVIKDDGITYTCVAAGGCRIEGRRVTQGTIQTSGGTVPPPAQTPDLVVEQPTVSKSTLAPGASFTLSATVKNQGAGNAAATTLRYYRSTNTTILSSDTEVGTDGVNALGSNRSSAESISLATPSSPGTYYYGACVEAVTGESSSNNNCSAAVSITVQGAPVVSTPTDLSIYWTDASTDKIQRANLDGSNVQDLVTLGLETPVSIALDVRGGKMYWTDLGTKKIQRANLDGSNVQDLVTRTQGLSHPAGIALDIAGGKMYWVDFGTDKIQRANLDGSSIQDLVTRTQGLSFPVSIALDVAGGKMYWTDYDTEKIQRANLDGSNVQDLVTRGLANPGGIALDIVGGKMYWTDYDTEKIQRANLDGSNVQDLITLGLIGPYNIALDVVGGKIYWTDGDAQRIQRANLDGSNVQDLITQGLGIPVGIAIGILPPVNPAIIKEDVNRDGVVDAQDIVYIGQRYGQTGQSRADVNGDGVVNIDDLILVAAVIDSAPAAPSIRSQLPKDLTAATVEGWLTEAKLRNNKTPTYQRGILTLEQLLAVLTPEETVLLPNYPNPFNPETWIPYHLANDTDVSLFIYDMDGALVRELDLGHQRAGYYTDRSRAAYWDGRNEWGERVASGVYFYQLRAGDYLKLRKMVILK